MKTIYNLLKPQITIRRSSYLIIILLLSCIINIHAQENRPLTPEKISKALEETVENAAPDPYRPGYHLMPKAGFMGDPDGGIYHKGWHHIFYMHHPFGPTPGPWYWGHARSRDLVIWEHYPPTLTPPYELGVRAMISGCCIVSPDSKPTAIYSSMHQGTVKQWFAKGDDQLMNWKHPESNPILTLEQEDVPDFEKTWRDPFVFEADGRYFMILFAERLEESYVHLPIFEAENKELSKWKYKGILFSEKINKVRNLEVPDFRKLGDKWILVISCGAHVDQTRYYIGDFDIENLKFIPEKDGPLDYSSHFYAQETIPGADEDELYVIGWFPGWDRDWMPNYRDDLRKNTGTWWNGCFSLPRKLSLDIDGNLIQNPVESIKTLRRDHVKMAKTELPVNGQLVEYTVLEDVKGDQLELMLELELGSSAFCGLNVLCDEKGSGGMPIMWYGNEIDVDGLDIPINEWKDGDAVKLRVFIDKMYVEVFINDGKYCISRKIKKDNIKGDHVALTRIGGHAILKSLNAWKIESPDMPEIEAMK